MKVVTLEIEDELYEDFKLFRNGYIKGFKHGKGQNQSHSSKRQVNWHEITLSQLMVERPDLVAAMDEAKGSWARAVCDVVSAIESFKKNETNSKDTNTPVVRLKAETREKWLSRQGVQNSDWLLVLLIIFNGVVIVMWLYR